MACGATLKRHREFDPLQQSSPDLSLPKRICLTPTPAVSADRLMSPSVPVSADRLLAAPSGSPAATTMTHSRLQQLGGSAFVEAAQKLIQARMSPHQREKLVDTSNNQMQPTSGALPPVAYQPWVGDQLPGVTSQPWQGSASSAAASGRAPARKEQLFSMRQVEVICRNVLKEHEESVRGEFDNILTNKLAEQYECLLRFNQAQIHSRFDKSDTGYVS